jgi:hypothetical protein
MPTVTAMLKIVTLTASLLAIGTAILALPQVAEARFGGAAIAEAAASSRQDRAGAASPATAAAPGYAPAARAGIVRHDH